MDNKTANEFIRGERHYFYLGFVLVVFPSKGHFSVLDVEDAMIGNGNPVGITAEIFKHRFWTGKWGLGINDPFVFAQGMAQGLKVVARRGAELAVFPKARQPAKILLPKDAGERFDGEQPLAMGASFESLSVATQGTARDNAMEMDVMLKALTPGVENGAEAELSVPMTRSEFLESFRSRLEQKIVNLLVIPSSPGVEVVRKRKNSMEIGNRKEFLFSRFYPACAFESLAFWTVAVTAGIVADVEGTTYCTNILVPPERGATAIQY